MTHRMIATPIAQDLKIHWTHGHCVILLQAGEIIASATAVLARDMRCFIPADILSPAEEIMSSEQVTKNIRNQPTK